ncbi:MULTISPECIES: right-handed parallel beta-helix repeat-containing protein [Methylobacterium]|uniref:Right handed beta helix domain-containing protein n=3 Tax=Pseudomonadota TaxID=1224 RepID=A0ABQ4SRN2_9HYPH|nr:MULTISPECIES: right-handed parallel beta-helix repeat-containing protein [Methylobacterium]PIU06192.1 MAG: right-handed parallel beta-helix repeat-containing protein [Methylobacterium sp. CG09_land_8_20_14_0_10_71_15]PIU14483.1 MAG: right-handed parallel beta-helix repeat-containing protein [Methylobacterium sp. CG08_land_8_20_14_0_20_71_15]GBU18243.1 hypothetical protein AwMethylo_24580 [Methylobacterium sp.]GJE05164.1 hypothetical protein AOPFMNJM_0461 [Methylobacterium jeotgali]
MRGTRTVFAAAVAAMLSGPAAARASESAPRAPACDGATRAAILAPATPGEAPFPLTCSLRLSPEDKVTRRLLIEGNAGSGVEIDCNGATIGRPTMLPAFGEFVVEIRSKRREAGPDAPVRWERPTDVSLKHCTILGHMRVWGMGLNGQGPALRASSRALGHTERAQAAAPTRITILDSTLTGLGGIPLYVAPGVTALSLRHSQITGASRSVAVYLDAESARNTIEDNSFDIDTAREVVAVDGSAGNRIVGNRFALRGERGINLYRNCGEGGTIRHQTPSDNLIADNRFRYTGFWRPDPIKVGSREGWRLYCAEDSGYPFGSSADNGDNATGNVLSGNVTE